MKYTIKGLGIDLTEGLKSHVEKSLEKLDKFFTDDTNYRTFIFNFFDKSEER